MQKYFLAQLRNLRKKNDKRLLKKAMYNKGFSRNSNILPPLNAFI